MRLCKRIFTIVLLASGACLSGCTMEEALREGLTDGVSSALSSIIQTPVNYVLEQTLSEP